MSPRLVESWAEVLANILTLDRYRQSPIPEFQDYFRRRIARGECYIACRVGGRRLFGPSRFIGYAENSKRRHDRNVYRHGTYTNAAIRSILNGEWAPSATLESEFQDFCRKHGIAPDDRTRKFIEVDPNRIAADSELLDDVAQVNRDRRVTKTVRSQLVEARIGQGQFRKDLVGIWQRCPVTKCQFQPVLRASHIKPWRACTNAERLDRFNGLLLAPSVDAAFDRGLITFDDSGKMIRSKSFPATEAKRLGIYDGTRIVLQQPHVVYMKYHRDSVFMG
jgi:hypothetical protein